MNDIWLFLGILAFFFILWIYAGGPTHPISFAGPYITPITNVDSTQTGYGDAVTTSGIKSYFGNVSNGKVLSNIPSSSRSPYAGSVHIGDSNPQGSSPSNEYVGVRNAGSAAVSLAGWQLADAVNKNNAYISVGSKGPGGAAQPIVLASGDNVVVSTGSSSTGQSSGGTWYVFLNVNHDIWNDSKDTLTLLDGNGKIVDQYQY